MLYPDRNCIRRTKEVDNSNQYAEGWKQQEIKKAGRRALKKNYFQVMLVSLVIFFFIKGFHDISKNAAIDNLRLTLHGQSNVMIVNDFISHANQSLGNIVKPYLIGKQGVMATLVNNVTKSGSFLFGILNAVNQMLFHGRVSYIIILFSGAFAALMFQVFVRNILRVGVARFFMENNSYSETSAGRVGYIYQLGKTKNVAKVMFFENLFLSLWYVTIVGGIIKQYSYRMIPYILAENPEMSRKDVFQLSKQMMKGNKWKVFLLDLSFLIWLIPVILSFGLVDYFFLYPYRMATYAQLYKELRADQINRKVPLHHFFLDHGLFQEITEEVYPVSAYPFAFAKHHKWTKYDYMCSYSIRSLILIFFIFCMVGWVWEVAFHFMNTGDFVNRGVLYGPWLPIYGSGGVLILIVLFKFRNRPLVYFGMTMLLCGTLEYFISWWLEYFKGAIWWDYHKMFLNLNGRICLEGLLFFGLGGMVFTYIFAPYLNQKIQKIPSKIAKVICTVLVICFLVDLSYSEFHPNMAAGKPIQSHFEKQNHGN